MQNQEYSDYGILTSDNISNNIKSLDIIRKLISM